MRCRCGCGLRLGSVAYGIKDNEAYFLLLFYGTVVGLEPALAGTALLIALLVDAVSDPIVGYWSDNTRSRLGRRHPSCMPAPCRSPCVITCCGSPRTGAARVCFLFVGFAS